MTPIHPAMIHQAWEESPSCKGHSYSLKCLEPPCKESTWSVRLEGVDKVLLCYKLQEIAPAATQGGGATTLHLWRQEGYLIPERTAGASSFEKLISRTSVASIASKSLVLVDWMEDLSLQKPAALLLGRRAVVLQLETSSYAMLMIAIYSFNVGF